MVAYRGLEVAIVGKGMGKGYFGLIGGNPRVSFTVGPHRLFLDFSGKSGLLILHPPLSTMPLISDDADQCGTSSWMLSSHVIKLSLSNHSPTFYAFMISSSAPAPPSKPQVYHIST